MAFLVLGPFAEIVGNARRRHKAIQDKRERKNFI